VTKCSVVVEYQCFGGLSYLHLQGEESMQANRTQVMMVLLNMSLQGVVEIRGTVLSCSIGTGLDDGSAPKWANEDRSLEKPC
jgi:hypothetical protein